ncbi:MAG: ABC transporter permease subunit [Candidatus Bathyarchaeia archaeon]
MRRSMADFSTVAFREFSNTVESRRFILLASVFGWVMAASMAAVISEQATLAGAMPRGFLGQVARGMTSTMILLAPIIGIALGCDAVSGEREKGTLKLVLAQPIYRDALITGKFLATLSAITLAIFIPSLATVGGGILYLGISPTLDELVRLLLYLAFSVVFAMTFYAISILLSTVSRSTSQSVMLSIGVWFVFTVIIPLMASTIARMFVGIPLMRPGNQTLTPVEMEQIRSFNNMVESISSITPNYHFNRIGVGLLGGFSSMGWMIGGVAGLGRIGAVESMSIIESLARYWPNITVLILVAIFASIASYMIFTRQEMR